MIKQNELATVNFFAITEDGLPATGKANSITANISFNGESETPLSVTITEKDPINLPGWYSFNNVFANNGNVFITFNCSGCIIQPWEDNVVALTVPSSTQIANAVWSYNGNRLVTNTIPALSDIVTQVWAYPNRLLTSAQIGFAGRLAFSSDIADSVTAIESYGDSKWSTATGFATPSDLPSDYAKPGDSMTLTPDYDAAKTASQLTSEDIPSDYAKPGDAMTLTQEYDVVKTAATADSVEKIHAGLFNWSVDNESIIAKNISGETIVTSSITRDSSGNIIAMEEDNVS